MIRAAFSSDREQSMYYLTSIPCRQENFSPQDHLERVSDELMARRGVGSFSRQQHDPDEWLKVVFLEAFPTAAMEALVSFPFRQQTMIGRRVSADDLSSWQGDGSRFCFLSDRHSTPILDAAPLLHRGYEETFEPILILPVAEPECPLDERTGYLGRKQARRKQSVQELLSTLLLKGSPLFQNEEQSLAQFLSENAEQVPDAYRSSVAEIMLRTVHSSAASPLVLFQRPVLPNVHELPCMLILKLTRNQMMKESDGRVTYSKNMARVEINRELLVPYAPDDDVGEDEEMRDVNDIDTPHAADGAQRAIHYLEYELQGLVLHDGSAPHSGHYRTVTSVGRRLRHLQRGPGGPSAEQPDASWWIFNNDDVQTVPDSKDYGFLKSAAVEQGAYMLIYALKAGARGVADRRGDAQSRPDSGCVVQGRSTRSSAPDSKYSLASVFRATAQNHGATVSAATTSDFARSGGLFSNGLGGVDAANDYTTSTTSPWRNHHGPDETIRLRTTTTGDDVDMIDVDDGWHHVFSSASQHDRLRDYDPIAASGLHATTTRRNKLRDETSFAAISSSAAASISGIPTLHTHPAAAPADQRVRLPQRLTRAASASAMTSSGTGSTPSTTTPRHASKAPSTVSDRSCSLLLHFFPHTARQEGQPLSRALHFRASYRRGRS